jgi:hypothetical protein
VRDRVANGEPVINRVGRAWRPVRRRVVANSPEELARRLRVWCREPADLLLDLGLKQLEDVCVSGLLTDCESVKMRPCQFLHVPLPGRNREDDRRGAQRTCGRATTLARSARLPFGTYCLLVLEEESDAVQQLVELVRDVTKNIQRDGAEVVA